MMRLMYILAPHVCVPSGSLPQDDTVGDLPNFIKLISAMSEFLKEEVSMFHDTGQIIHIDANKLIMSATILHPNIWIGFAGI